jgi:glycosyltransferase involved in cell wall biosynthesis
MIINKVPLISVVVPTRNRHVYLMILARALLASVAQDFELLIYDNSDEPGGFEAGGGILSDSRLRYFCDSTPMSITQNFEKALSQARGDYVCMIGDDDGVPEGLFVLERWLKQHNIDAATTGVATYLWPGVESSLDGKQTTGVLRIPRYSSSVEFVNSSSALN